MKTEHILIIKQFLEHPDLLDLHSYSGYNGGIVLRLRTANLSLLEQIQQFCDQHDIEVTSKFNHNLGTNEIFVIAPDDVYKLKQKDIK